MKKVLVCKPLMEESEESVCQYIIASLKEQKCDTEICTLQECGNIKSQAVFDVILAFNKSALIAITEIARVKRIPIVYIFFDIQNNIVWNHPLVKVNISIGNPKNRIPPFILQNKYYHFLPPIFHIKKENAPFTAKDKVHLLFCVPDDILLSLIPRINKIVHYKTKVICENYTFFRDVFNTHIDVIENNNISLSEYVYQTDIFIGYGYGYGAAVAISNCKSTIVLGPKGYGGRITPINLKWQAENGLTGRIGGDYEEPIPVHLIFKEIDSCVHTLLTTPESDLLLKLSHIFYAFNKSSLDRITNLILNSPSEYKTSFEDTLFVWSPDFTISAISNNRYVVTDQRINKYAIILNEKEYDCTKLFSTPHSFNQISEHVKNLSSTEIKDLISDLLFENILKTINR